MKTFDILVAGCGSVGLPLLKDLIQKNKESSLKIIALEASSRIGGSNFFASRLFPNSQEIDDSFELEKKIPALKVWWDREWLSPNEVDWSSKEWAFVLPQWQAYFSDCSTYKLKNSSSEILQSQLQNFIQNEKPISEVKHEDNLWVLRSGEETYSAPKLYWTLGLKNFQNCYGKKQSEEFLVKNHSYLEEAREAEGVLAAEYTFPQSEQPTADSFVAIPVRYESKLYLSFAFLSAQKVETFTYLHNDLLKSPKELSSFEKALKRSLKHVFANTITELEEPNLGIINEARGFDTALPWTLEDCPEKGIFFAKEKGSLPQSEEILDQENTIQTNA